MQSIGNKDIFFIINPNSGKKQANKFVGKINSRYSDIAYVITNNLKELETAFQQNIENYKVFIVVGGDGTLNESLKYLYKREDKLLGIFPLGSGNGFARELGFNKNLGSLIRDIKKGNFLKIDLLSVNNKLCINTTGVGFNSFVAHKFNTSRSRGLKKYISSTIKSLIAFQPFNGIIEIDNNSITDRFMMITAANTRQFGNNAIIAPMAKPNDGIFELVLLKPIPFYLYPFFIIKLFSGKLKKSKYISYIKVSGGVTIKTDFNKYHIDGDPYYFKDHLSIKLIKNKIRIIQTKNNRLLNKIK